jgi:outer membrane protein
MNRKFALITALAAGLLPAVAVAQVSPAVPQPATPAPQTEPASPAAANALPPPEAFPAKIALIDFDQAVLNTNEGQRTVEEIEKKYQPQKSEIDNLGAEIEALKKQVDATPSTLTQEERNTKLKNIDTKEKQYQTHVDDARTAYNGDLEEAFNKIAPKVATVMRTYAKDHGYTIVLNYGDQQSQVIMWAAQSPSADITEAIIAAYNTSSGIAPPPPAAPTPSSAPRPKPSATTTPHTSTPAAPKQPATH